MAVPFCAMGTGEPRARGRGSMTRRGNTLAPAADDPKMRPGEGHARATFFPPHSGGHVPALGPRGDTPMAPGPAGHDRLLGRARVPFTAEAGGPSRRPLGL